MLYVQRLIYFIPRPTDDAGMVMGSLVMPVRGESDAAWLEAPGKLEDLVARLPGLGGANAAAVIRLVVGSLERGRSREDFLAPCASFGLNVENGAIRSIGEHGSDEAAHRFVRDHLLPDYTLAPEH